MAHEQTAKQFCEALRTIAGKPEWLAKFANTPEGISAELQQFSEIII